MPPPGFDSVTIAEKTTKKIDSIIKYVKPKPDAYWHTFSKRTGVVEQAVDLLFESYSAQIPKEEGGKLKTKGGEKD